MFLRDQRADLDRVSPSPFPLSLTYPRLACIWQMISGHLHCFAELLKTQHLGEKNPHSSFYAKLSVDFADPGVRGTLVYIRPWRTPPVEPVCNLDVAQVM